MQPTPLPAFEPTALPARLAPDAPVIDRLERELVRANETARQALHYADLAASADRDTFATRARCATWAGTVAQDQSSAP